MSDIIESLLAMDRLNSWVRSRSCRGGLTSMSLRRHIYRAKGEAIRTAHAAGISTHRPLTVLASCRTCDGTAVFTYWGLHAPYDTATCRRCNGSGTVRLEFVETRIETGIKMEPILGIPCVVQPLRWHSPRYDGFPLSQLVLGAETTAGDWAPNQPGREMTPDEAACDLMTIDAAWPVPHWSDFNTRFYDFYIGESVATCAHCGAEILPGDHRCGGHKATAHFTFAACDRCYKSLTSEALFNVEIPKHLLDDQPNVLAWMRQRLADMAQFAWEKERKERYA